MDIDVENRRQILALTVGVVVVAIVASVGFASLSENPLVPDASFDARDADQPYNLSQPGTVDMFVVEHTGGEPVETEDVQLLLGSRADGFRFNESGNWSNVIGEFEFSVRLNGRPVVDADTFSEGDRLVVSKTAGTGRDGESFDVRVRLFHLPSQTAILDQRVEVR